MVSDIQKMRQAEKARLYNLVQEARSKKSLYFAKKQAINNAITQMQLAEMCLENAETSLKENYNGDASDCNDMKNKLQNTQFTLKAKIRNLESLISMIDTRNSQLDSEISDCLTNIDNIIWLENT